MGWGQLGAGIVSQIRNGMTYSKSKKHINAANAKRQEGFGFAKEAYAKYSDQAREDYTSQMGNARTAVNTNFDAAATKYQPYEAAGRRGLDMLESLLSNPSSISSNPGYQFRRAEGLRAVEQSKAYGGKLFSGEGMKAMQNYASEFASTEFDKSVSQYGKLADMGFQASGAVAQLLASRGLKLADLEQAGAKDLSALSTKRAEGLANLELGLGFSNAKEKDDLRDNVLLMSARANETSKDIGAGIDSSFSQGGQK